MEKILLKVQESLPFFPAGWTSQRIYAAVRSGEIPAGVVVMIGGRKGIRFHRERLTEWAASRPELISADQAAEILDCNRQLIYSNASDGVFSADVVQRKNGRLFFDRSALERWLERGGSLAA